MDSNKKNSDVSGLSDALNSAAVFAETLKSAELVSSVSPMIGNAVSEVSATPSIDSILDTAGTQTGFVDSGATIDDVRPGIQGHGGQPGTTVEIYDQKGELVAAAKVDRFGDWNARVFENQALAQGEHVLTAVSEDGVRSEPFTLHVDIPASSRPTIDAAIDNVGVTGEVANGGTTDDRTPQLSGHGMADTQVLIYIDGQLVDSAPVGSDGSWTYNVNNAKPLAPGEHVFKVSGLGIASEPFVLTVGDTEPVSKPVIESAFDDFGTPGYVANGGNTDDTTPTLQGHGAAPDAQLAIYDGGTRLGYALVNSDGSWRFDVKTPLGLGEHMLTVAFVTPSGIESRSEPFTLTVEAPDSPKPMIDSAFDDFGTPGYIANGGNTDDATPKLQGKGAVPNTQLEVYDGSTRLGYAYTDGDGNWTFNVNSPLTLGEHAFTVVGAGVSSDAFVLNITAPEAAKLVIDSAFDNFGQTGAIGNGDTTDDVNPKISGHGQPNTQIFLYEGNTYLGQTIVKADGSWSLYPNTVLASGEHAFTVQDYTGVKSEPFVLHVALPEAAKLVIDSAFDNFGQTGAIGNGDTTDDVNPKISGHGQPNTQIFLYEGNTYLGQTIVKADGSWSLYPNAVLASGEHAFTVQDYTGVKSEPFVLHVALPEAAKLVIDSVIDNVGGVEAIVSGGVTDDARPTFHGHSDYPATWIYLFDGDQAVGSSVVNPDGSWDLASAHRLEEGQHEFTVRGTDSQVSEPFRLTVADAPVEQKLEIDSVTDNVGVTGIIGNGGTTDDGAPVFHGHGEPDAPVYLYIDATYIGSTIVQSDGSWELDIAHTDAGNFYLGKGGYTATVTSDEILISDPFVLHVAADEPNAGLASLSIGDLLQAPGELFAGAADISPAGQDAQVFDLSAVEFDADSGHVDTSRAEATGVSVSLPTAPLSELLELHAA
ncbi:Ig-like domain-containing protein [Collimonas sp.]|uniref:Ig-like domain-containing protein n=1 Tax=Collimonas sp. TaxID=1963772 RepID=UPI002CB7ABB7|nr:Ig-like domain-containing protein [Collimonas sp.]HWX02011.1 Ig-like domain-containing protein [Collimonas sp.]